MKITQLRKDDFYVPILETLNELGGSGSVEETDNRVIELMSSARMTSAFDCQLLKENRLGVTVEMVEQATIVTEFSTKLAVLQPLK